MQVSSIESSLNTTYKWLNEFKEFGNFRDESQSYSVLRVVLHHLRDKLPLDVSAHLAAQFPLVLKGLYYDGWDPSHEIDEARTFDEFIEPMMKELNNLNVDIKESVRDCIKFLNKKLERDLSEKVMQSLPHKLRNALLH
ncbi:DUF2267 domain-containing protein [Legionella clemsonensis]|uniref:DUF2267 domain-containing protein n=1 Tax=Legionella clemsonensis TaxID=1867846 RepID=A0A222NZG6_9GAMM|nr:DUF2267 domain-containing protein [Legionella clemsonensis]ASQ44994.1 hypothetical protein clem_02155 [Legionella clemsonensis]